MNLVDNTLHAISNPLKSFPYDAENYAEMLEYYGLEYSKIEYSLLVGNIPFVQGWILHLSVVISQAAKLFSTVIPILKEEDVCFKIPEDKDTCRYLLNGYLGDPQVGKIISIYPTNITHTLALAVKLISITKCYKSPKILTDIHLASAVYTRFGSGNPVIQTDTKGRKEKYIYNYRR